MFKIISEVRSLRLATPLPSANMLASQLQFLQPWLQPKSLHWYSTHFKHANEAEFEITKPYKLHRLATGPESKVKVTREEALHMYRQMLTIRKLEAVCNGLYREGLIRGFCHLYSGEEACGVGIKAGLKAHDSVVTSFRQHGWAYLMGIDPYQILAELFGRVDGCTRGKGGSMHMYTKNYYGGNGIVGAQVPLGTGLAFMNKYKDDGGVSVALYGDGASNQGQVFEAMNLAKLWQLPCLFICENNGFGMGTPVQRTSADLNLYQKGDTIPGIWVDGMDVLAVREATKFCRKLCADGKGPVLIEVDTFLFLGHSCRARVDAQEVRHHRDPLALMKERIESGSLATSKELKDYEHQITQDIRDQVAKAGLSPEPPMNELASDVYCVNLEGAIRGCEFDQKLESRAVFIH